MMLMQHKIYACFANYQWTKYMLQLCTNWATSKKPNKWWECRITARCYSPAMKSPFRPLYCVLSQNQPTVTQNPLSPAQEIWLRMKRPVQSITMLLTPTQALMFIVFHQTITWECSITHHLVLVLQIHNRCFMFCLWFLHHRCHLQHHLQHKGKIMLSVKFSITLTAQHCKDALKELRKSKWSSGEAVMNPHQPLTNHPPSTSLFS